MKSASNPRSYCAECSDKNSGKVRTTQAAPEAAFNTERKPMRTHETTIGGGNAAVTCRYHFDDDGDLEELQVIYGGIDIVDALSEPQLDEIERECRAAAKADYEERKDDTRIENYIEETTA